MTREDRMYELVEEIRKDIGDMKITLSLNTAALEEHIRRTELLEQKVETLDTDVTKLRGFFSIFGWIIGVAATVLTVLDRLGKL